MIAKEESRESDRPVNERPLVESEAGVATPSRVRPVWGLLEIVLAVVAYLALGAVLLFGVAEPLGLRETQRTRLNSELATTIILDLLIVGFIIWLVRRRGGDLRVLGFRALPTRMIYLLMPVFGLFSAFAILIVYSLAMEWLGLSELVPKNNVPSGVFDDPVSTALFGAVAIAAAPFAEEVVFRGFLFGGLQRWLPVWAAALLSGLLFGLVHAQPGLGIVIPVALIGTLLAIIYYTTGSIYASMLTHFLFNAASFLAMLRMEL